MSDRKQSVEGLKMLNIETIHSEGNFEFKIEMTEEFENWFKKEQGLKNWSEKRFNEWFKAMVSSGLPEVHKILLADSVDAATGQKVVEGKNWAL